MYLKIFNLYLLTGQLLPVYPIYVLLFQSKGLSLMEISALFMIWSIPGLLLEVPSSLLADKWNRRNLLVIGRTLKVFCFIVWAFSKDFSGFALGFLLWGSGGALTSGTEEAWLYDALKAALLEHEFDRRWGRGMFYSQLAVAISSVTGSLLATYDMQLTLWISVAMVFFSTCFAACLPEFNHSKGIAEQETGCTTEKQTFKHYFSTLIEGARFCLTFKHIPLMIGFSVTVIVTAGVLDEYDQLIARSMGIPLGLVGTWLMLRYGMEALGSRMAWRINSICKHIGIKSAFVLQLYLAVFSGFLLLLAAIFPIIYLLPVYGLYYFVMSSAKVLFTDSLQQSIENQGRATVQSLAAMLEAPGGILIYAIFGGFGQFFDLHVAMLSISVWIFMMSLLFLLLFKKLKLK